jgi:O-antigen/teichoic acid export membrane protein
MVAAFVGKSWAVLLQLVLVPQYIALLGIEFYGLVGFYMMLQATFQVLDLGVSQTVTRELARHSTAREPSRVSADLVHTLQLFYWALGVALGLGLIVGADWIAGRWIAAGSLPVPQVAQAVRWMGVLTMLQWPVSFYEGGLLGMQRPVTLNIAKVALSTLSAAGVLLVLRLVSRTITAFFAWQAAIGAAYVVVLAFLLWWKLPRPQGGPRFSPGLLRDVRQFALGMSGITLTALVLTQLDKIILVRLVHLQDFGYYVLAGTVSAGLYLIISPIFNVLFPRFAALVEAGDVANLRHLYHVGSQLMAVLILPTAAALALFPHEILLAWTGDAGAAAHAAPIVRLLVIGTALNGLMNLPYALQLAEGWVGLALRINVGLILAMAPALLVAVPRLGPAGAAWVWLGLNALYILIAVPWMHRRLLRGDAWRWWVRDVGPPLVAALAIALPARLWIVEPLPRLATLAWVAAVVAAGVAAGIAVTPHLRAEMTKRLVARVADVG